MTTERMVQLALSQRAAQLLESGIQELLADSRMTDREEAIYLAISRDLTDQFEATKPKAKKKKKVKK